jgi:hypothetical protein
MPGYKNHVLHRSGSLFFFASNRDELEYMILAEKHGDRPVK